MYGSNTIMTTRIQDELTAAQRIALAKICALRKLSMNTGTLTTKTQNDSLQSLTSDDLSAVAMALYNIGY